MIREGIEDYMRYRADTGKLNHHYLSLLKIFDKPNFLFRNKFSRGSGLKKW
jgi:hypothetical protein